MIGVRFAALGDSITVGMGDPMPDGRWRGWAALVADCLGPPGSVKFYNLAEPGAMALTLRHRQLPVALKLRPTLAAVIVGANDALRGSFDLAQTGLALDEAIGAMRATGIPVLTARLPDPGRGCWSGPPATGTYHGRRRRSVPPGSSIMDS